MILESFVFLIGGLVAKKVGTDIATNIENRIINVAIDAVSQRQLPSLTTLERYMSGLQKKQNEMLALQIREIKRHYDEGRDFLSYANTATSNKQKKQFIRKAIECFTSASRAEDGKAAVQARVLVGACFYALRRIDPKTNVALENGEYDKAFQLAEQSLELSGKPPRDLIEQLLRLPYLSGKYGTFEVYWQKWDPPKRIEAPPKLLPPPQRFQTPWVGVTNRPVSRSYLGYASKPAPGMVRKSCWKCYKEYDVPYGQSPYTLFCPECINGLPKLK